MKTFIPQIRTKNPTSAPLRGQLGDFSMRSMVRLGSRTSIEDAYPRKPIDRPVIEINTIDAIENSRSKLLMKACFSEAGVPQADWWIPEPEKPWNLLSQTGVTSSEYLPYPILIKRVFGFKGRGMLKIDTQEQLDEWIQNNLHATSWYIEHYRPFAREYRLHCTQSECFMTWRKLRRADAENRWFFNSTNCNWVGEDHPLFDRPSNWGAIVETCINATKAVGLDITAIDVRVQSSNKTNPEFIVLECNSAPALGDQGVEIYKQKIKELINEKITKYNEEISNR